MIELEDICLSVKTTPSGNICLVGWQPFASFISQRTWKRQADWRFTEGQSSIEVFVKRPRNGPPPVVWHWATGTASSLLPLRLHPGPSIYFPRDNVDEIGVIRVSDMICKGTNGTWRIFIRRDSCTVGTANDLCTYFSSVKLAALGFYKWVVFLDLRTHLRP